MFKKLLLPLVILFTITSSANPQTNWKKFSYFTNQGGLNDQLSSTEISDNEASDLQNVVFDTGGAIKKRFGYQTIPNSPSALKATTGTNLCVTGVFFLKTDAGTKSILTISNADEKAKAFYKLYEVGGGPATGSWVDITDGSGLPSTSYSNNYLVSGTTAKNLLVFAVPSTTGVKPFQWGATGNVVTLTGNANCPNASIVTYHKNHLFLNDTANLSRIWFSNLDDIYTYTATDFIDLDNQDGTRIRGMISAYNSLYIFKDRSIWRLSGYDRDSWVLEKMVDGIGTLSHNSIRIVNNIIYFITSQNDIAIYDGSYTVKFLSQKIRNTIGGLNFARATSAVGLGFSTYKYNDYDYYASVTVSGSSENDKILVFDTAFNAWTKLSGINANAMCLAEDEDGKNILVFGDYDGYVSFYPSTNYYDGDVNKTAISSYYQTKWFKYSDLSLGDKYWRVINTYALSETSTSTNLTIECKKDYETTGTFFIKSLYSGGALWDSAYWDFDIWAGQSLKILRDEVELGTSMFQVKFSNNESERGFTVLGFENFIEPTIGE